MSKHRINLVLSDEAHVIVAASAALRGVTMTEFIVKAIRVYNALIKEEAAGNTIYVGTKERVTKEIILP